MNLRGTESESRQPVELIQLAIVIGVLAVLVGLPYDRLLSPVTSDWAIQASIGQSLLSVFMLAAPIVLGGRYLKVLFDNDTSGAGCSRLAIGGAIVVSVVLLSIEAVALTWAHAYQIKTLAPFSPGPEGLAVRLFTEVVVISLVAPIGEELFYRGYLQGAIASRFGPTWAVLAQATVAFLLHIQLQGRWSVFVLALLLGTYVARKKRILLPIMIHITVNTYATIFGIS